MVMSKFVLAETNLCPAVNAILQVSVAILPPVPSPLVKSPPWIIKSLMTLWNLLPL